MLGFSIFATAHIGSNGLLFQFIPKWQFRVVGFSIFVTARETCFNVFLVKVLHNVKLPCWNTLKWNKTLASSGFLMPPFGEKGRFESKLGTLFDLCMNWDYIFVTWYGFSSLSPQDKVKMCSFEIWQSKKVAQTLWGTMGLNLLKNKH